MTERQRQTAMLLGSPWEGRERESITVCQGGVLLLLQQSPCGSEDDDSGCVPIDEWRAICSHCRLHWDTLSDSLKSTGTPALGVSHLFHLPPLLPSLLPPPHSLPLPTPLPPIASPHPTSLLSVLSTFVKMGASNLACLSPPPPSLIRLLLGKGGGTLPPTHLSLCPSLH